MPDVVGVVLAAGKGTRMKSRLPKAVHPLCGKPMGRYPVDLCRAIGVERVLVVVGHEADAVRAALGDDVEYVEQSPQRGTGDAVRQAVAALGRFDSALLVLQADTPLATPEMLAAMLQRHQETGAAATLLAAVLEDPARYGRVVRDPNGRVARIVEYRDAPPEIAAIREINSGTYCFASGPFLAALEAIRPDNQQGEYYLTDVIGILAERGERVDAFVAPDPAAALGINDRVELARAEAVVRARILRELMLAGVSIVDPATTYVDATVKIAPDTVIQPMTVLAGRTEIGSDCRIGPQARITDCTLGNGVQAQYCVLAESEVGDGSRVGPFAQLRPGCRVGRRCKIGNFVELKSAVVEDRVSIGHLAYMGDVVIGSGTNIGAGAITCNYDGRAKHVTQIGKNSFIGTHATLVAPVSIGDGAYVAAASPVTEDVEPEALVIARARQTVKPGWARKRREEGR